MLNKMPGKLICMLDKVTLFISFLLLKQGLIDLDKEISQLTQKVKQISDKQSKLSDTMSKTDYSSKVPASVQADNTKKVCID